MLRKSLALVLLGLIVITLCNVRAEDNTPNIEEKIAAATTKTPAKTPTWPQAKVDEISRYMGYMFAEDLQGLQYDEFKFNLEEISKGIKESLTATEPLSTEEQVKGFLATLSDLQETAFNYRAAKNLSLATEYLAKSTEVKDMVEIEPSKLYYKVLKNGEGNAITDTSSPMVTFKEQYLNHENTFSDGKSYDKVVLPMEQMAEIMPHLQKTLLGMKEGESRQILMVDNKDGNPPNALKKLEIAILKANISPPAEEIAKRGGSPKKAPPPAPKAEMKAKAEKKVKAETKVKAKKKAKAKKRSIHHLKAANFDAQIKKGVVLVDFYATWCGPCKKMEPDLKKFTKETEIKVAKVDVDKSPKLAAKYDVKAMPTLILFKNGREVKRKVGALNLKGLQKFTDIEPPPSADE